MGTIYPNYNKGILIETIPSTTVHWYKIAITAMFTLLQVDIYSRQ